MKFRVVDPRVPFPIQFKLQATTTSQKRSTAMAHK